MPIKELDKIPQTEPTAEPAPDLTVFDTSKPTKAKTKHKKLP